MLCVTTNSFCWCIVSAGAKYFLTTNAKNAYLVGKRAVGVITTGGNHEFILRSVGLPRKEGLQGEAGKLASSPGSLFLCGRGREPGDEAIYWKL